MLLELLYTVFSEYNAIARSVCVKNTGTETVHLLNVMSLSLDLPDQDYVWMQLSGAWARERYIKEHWNRESQQLTAGAEILLMNTIHL